MLARHRSVLFLAVFFSAGLAVGDTVLSRSRSAYEPKGIPLGGFVAYPSANLDFEYTDNVYASSSRLSDNVRIIRPALYIVSRWPIHQLKISAGWEDIQYRKFDLENQQNWSLGLQGRLVPSRKISFVSEFSRESKHEERGSYRDLGGESPAAYTLDSVNLSYRQRFSRFSIKLGNLFESISYGEKELINYTDLNRNQLLFSLRLNYHADEENTLFIQTDYYQSDFDTLDRLGNIRDSHGMEWIAGMNYSAPAVIQFQWYLGYREQIYQQSNFFNLYAPTYGVTILWNPTKLTTLTGRIGHQTYVSGYDNSWGLQESSAEINLDHELRRNFLLQWKSRFALEDYLGEGRDDKVSTQVLGAKYLLNHNLSFSFNYQFQRRSSDLINVFNYETNLISIAARGQF